MKWLDEKVRDNSLYTVIGHPFFRQEIIRRGVDFVEVGDDKVTPVSGNPNEAGAISAMEALELSAQGCIDGKYSSVVTLPISKLWMDRVVFAYPGHTEFFADRWKGEPTMAFVGSRMKVVLMTWHIPLMSVGAELKEPKLYQAISRANELVIACGNATPRIAVCGLNPHAGENGILGSEEVEFLSPYLSSLKKEFPDLSGPYPPDTVFWRHLRGDFDVVVALYHDQGLIPLKTVEFETAVNVTMGLPYVRTSPDHGTGFDIAGKGIATTSSFDHAVKVCKQLVDARN
jgi:4-hydroxythreonine-4-phosphate dehydrogenase